MNKHVMFKLEDLLAKPEVSVDIHNTRYGVQRKATIGVCLDETNRATAVEENLVHDFEVREMEGKVVFMTPMGRPRSQTQRALDTFLVYLGVEYTTMIYRPVADVDPDEHFHEDPLDVRGNEDTPSLQSADLWGTGEGQYHGLI